uniref:U5 small nuclear ribonucleoprotein TSSC4 n=1 Tax=Kalanchoe fedtschenkoi TaxID=63787 RepID=A0A7N0UPN5_KALFE
MEDSFKVRVDRVFGSLSDDSQPLNSLWSLTDQEIERKERKNRHKLTPDHLTGPFGGDLEDVDDEDEEEEFHGDSSSGLSVKPDDHDQEEWQIRSSIGMDCTLDNEEEEDEFDKVAVGSVKIGERTYMINDYSSWESHELPTSVEDVVRDPRANHIAAELKLKEDARTIRNSKSSGGSQIVLPSTNTPTVIVKSILRNEKKAQLNSRKRVRFGPEIPGTLDEQAPDRPVKLAIRSGEGSQASFLPLPFDPRVPDFLRNPSKYTHYTFDSTDELCDEVANKNAYMDFINLVRKNHTRESQAVEDMDKSPGAITFTPRKKTGDNTTGSSVPTTRSSCKETYQVNRASPVILAHGEACAMEEDEPDRTPTCSTILRKAQRQYRAKSTLELLDE